MRETPPEANPKPAPKSTPNQGGEVNGKEGAAVDTLNNSYCVRGCLAPFSPFRLLVDCLCLYVFTLSVRVS